MKQIRLLTGMLFGVLMSGCASLPESFTASELPLNDDVFTQYHEYTPESADEIFKLDAAAREFVDNSQSPLSGDGDNLKNLIRQIFDGGELGIRYITNANTIASETFANRAANCLSLTIMAKAMADYAGFNAVFYEVDIPEYWTRRSGVNLLNGHINLRVSVADTLRKNQISSHFIDVDFDPQTIRSHFPRNAISKEKVTAMFYNNKGADALLNNDDIKAYAYLRAAALLYPEFGSTWVNLGVLYRRHGLLDSARESYELALKLDSENLTAWENLALLHELEGRTAQARDIARSVRNKRESNPFYHFILGEEALDFGDPEQALIHYNRARRLDNSRHEIFFGMGKAHYELGNIDRAADFMKLAAKHAQNRQDEYRYMSKLSDLQSAR